MIRMGVHDRKNTHQTLRMDQQELYPYLKEQLKP